MLEKRKTPVGLYVTLGVILMILSYYVSGLFTFDDLSMNNMQDYLVYIALHFWQVTRWYNDKTIPIMGLGFLGWVFIIYYFIISRGKDTLKLNTELHLYVSFFISKD